MRKARKKRVVPRKRTAKKKVVRKVRKGAKVWTKAEVVMLRKLYRSTPTTQIAKKLRRSTASVQAKAQTLGLRKAVRKAATKRKAAAKRKPAKKRVAKRKPAKKKKVAKKKTARKRR